jgi:hypothetical protein
MDRYRAFLIKRTGFPIRALWIEAEDQQQAEEKARSYCDENVWAELWRNGSLVGQVGPDPLVPWKWCH